MSKAKHTPGPWQWTQHFDPTISIYKDGFGTLARLYDSAAGTGKANARLIAAAPDLLEALQRARSEIWSLLDSKGVHPKHARNWPEILAADSAIAKATGGEA